jgi:hypothetical protein
MCGVLSTARVQASTEALVSALDRVNTHCAAQFREAVRESSHLFNDTIIQTSQTLQKLIDKHLNLVHEDVCESVRIFQHQLQLANNQAIEFTSAFKSSTFWLAMSLIITAVVISIPLYGIMILQDIKYWSEIRTGFIQSRTIYLFTSGWFWISIGLVIYLGTQIRAWILTYKNRVIQVQLDLVLLSIQTELHYNTLTIAQQKTNEQLQELAKTVLHVGNRIALVHGGSGRRIGTNTDCWAGIGLTCHPAAPTNESVLFTVER